MCDGVGCGEWGGVSGVGEWGKWGVVEWSGVSGAEKVTITKSF